MLTSERRANIPRMFRALLIACVALCSLLAISPGTASAQASVPIEKELTWFWPESEIATPQFSPDGNSIVLATRVHWPDGHEAEGVPESFLKKLDERKRADSRFADPVVRQIDLKGRLICEIRYGSSPTVAPDNKSIVYSRQTKPITGLRQLAETLAGNDIQVFDCDKKETKLLAKPDAGYFDNPEFLPDGKSIAFTTNEAINGAYGGPVGFERVDLLTGQESVLLKKESIPAIPCPPAGSEKSDFERFMCSQGSKEIKLSSAFPSLVLASASADGQFLVLQAVPLRSAGNIYMSSYYIVRLLSLFPSQNQVLSMGEVDPGRLGDFAIQSAGQKLLVFSEYWKPFSLKTKSWLPDIGPRNVNPRSAYSPDLKYYVAVEPREDPDHISVYRVADGRRTYTSPKQAGVYDVTWGPDSKRFAVVVVPRGVSGSAYHEDLIVYTVR